MKKPPPVCRIETCFHLQTYPDPDQLCRRHYWKAYQQRRNAGT